MQRQPIITKDGSHSISVPELNVTYHSVHGAIQESMHVFINAGLQPLLNNQATESFSIVQVGFGTRLNALLTAIETGQADKIIYYVALEPFPLSNTET